MARPFVYGMSVGEENFTDRELETKRLRLNFENGVNSIIISPRRMGKTSLVKHVQTQMQDNDDVKVVYMDIYKCRTEYDFYEKYASSIIAATSTRIERIIETAKEFLMGITPKLSYTPEPTSDFSLSLGITPSNNPPEEILELPERIASKMGVNIVVCIDEFQQVGEFPNSLSVQRCIRSVWQHHKHASYCLFGSKQHLMSQLFYSRKMPFYQFGDMFFLKKIGEEHWVPYIVSRFASANKVISSDRALRICQRADCYPSYVQQLAWNVMANSGDEVTDDDLDAGFEATMAQVSPLFVEQTSGLTTYQLNFIRAICSGYHKNFGQREVTSLFDLGTRSNLPKIINRLTEKELIETSDEGVVLGDPLFEYWFAHNMM